MKIAPATRSLGMSLNAALQRREQARAVGVAAGFAGLDEAHFEIGNAPEPLGERGAHRFGLLGAVAEFLARALVDDDDRDRGERDRGPRG